jgi:hypothetical protein
MTAFTTTITHELTTSSWYKSIASNQRIPQTRQKQKKVTTITNTTHHHSLAHIDTANTNKLSYTSIPAGKENTDSYSSDSTSKNLPARHNANQIPGTTTNSTDKPAGNKRSNKNTVTTQKQSFRTPLTNYPFLSHHPSTMTVLSSANHHQNTTSSNQPSSTLVAIAKSVSATVTQHHTKVSNAPTAKTQSWTTVSNKLKPPSRLLKLTINDPTSTINRSSLRHHKILPATNHPAPQHKPIQSWTFRQKPYPCRSLTQLPTNPTGIKHPPNPIINRI